MPHRACLAIRSAARHSNMGIKLVGCSRNGQRLRGDDALGFDREIVFEGSAVYLDLASAGSQADAGDGGLAPAGAQMLGSFAFRYLNIGHKGNSCDWERLTARVAMPQAAAR